MEKSNNLVNHKLLIKQYLCPILEISAKLKICDRNSNKRNLLKLVTILKQHLNFVVSIAFSF